MKRPRSESDDEDESSVKKELKDLKELILRGMEKNSVEKRVKVTEAEVDDEEDDKDQGMFSGLFNLIKPAPLKTEAIIAKHWGNKILNGEIKCNIIPYDDAGNLNEYELHVNYPNYLDFNHVLELSSKIPHLYKIVLDSKGCTAGKMRAWIQQCKSQKLIRLLNRDQLKSSTERPSASILGNDDKNKSGDHHKELDKRISKIFAISSTQSPDLPAGYERSIKGIQVGVIHRNIDPPITNSDIAAIMDIPLVHSLRFQPEKTRVGIVLTLQIQKI